MTQPRPAATTLAGYAVAVTDLRQERLAALLRERGASVVEVPLLRLVPADRDALLRSATRDCLSGAVDYAVVSSAAGWLRCFEAARLWGRSAALKAALAQASLVSASVSVSAAIRDTGLREAWSAPSGELAAAVDWLLERELAQCRVILMADETPPVRLLRAVQARGAEVVVVPTRRWAPPAGLGPVHRLARLVIHREVHAATFTDRTGVAALVEVAERTGRREGLLRAFATDVLAVGADPGSVRPLVERAIPVSWVAGAGGAEELAGLVSTILLSRRREFRVGADHFTVQGDAVLVGASVIRLASAPAAVLRALADHPGATLPRATIAQLAPLSRRAGPLGVDLAVSRLRAALGEYERLVVTVPGRGYQLTVDAPGGGAT